MKIDKQIEVVKSLLEATRELNGEYQEGWHKEIEDGEELLSFLKSQIKKDKRVT